MFLDLIQNLTLLITLCWLHGMLMRYVDGHIRLGKVCAGILFGTVCTVGMMLPVELEQGLIFDGRTVVLSMAALFGGPLVGVIAGGIAGLYRLWIGGIGVIPGLLNVLMPVLMGLAFYRLHQQRRVSLNAGSLLVFALMVQGLQILILKLLPESHFALFLERALWPMLAVLIPSTVLLGLVLRDVRQQTADREALRESEAYLRAIIEAAPDLTLVLDEDGRLIKIKTPDSRLLPPGRTELRGKYLHEVLTASEAELLLQFVGLTLTSDAAQTIEYSMQTQLGLRTFETRARRLDTRIQGKQAVLLMARDISERIALELDRRIAAIAFESQQGMMITDAQTRIIKANAAFSKISGYSQAEVIGQPTRMLGSGRQSREFYQQMWQSIAQNGVWEGEIWNRRKNGEVFPEWLTVSAVHDAQGDISNYVASLTDISERKSAEQKIQHLAFFDPLTGLPNRRLLRDRLQQAIILCSRKDYHAALVFLDLDDFKNVNDLYGHQVGDELLCQVAERLKQSTRELDTVARLGGDEFVILLEELEPHAEEAAAQVERIGSKLLNALRDPYQVNGQRFHNSASLGVVLFNDESKTADELMQQADLSMYNAKASGKNSLRFYDPQMQVAVSMRLKLERDIRRGLAEGEFELFLQAQTNAQGTLEGAEALVRWQHPEQGLLGPGTFIPAAEHSDLIELLDLEVLRLGCLLLARWAEQPDMADLSLALNISARLLYKNDFLELIAHLLQATQANPLRLKLEITESLLLTDKETAVTRMQALRALGIRFSIDDFGTGYSSMAYLQQLPLDQLKIDQSFVRELPDNASSLAIVRAILAMAQSLGLEVIAEGVETPAQHAALLGSGCQHFQGYLFGKPLAVEAFESTQPRTAGAQESPLPL
jgi:diguanylate cyclase (GGDEF)-like protein/PAS domain S-box-containing protein